MRPGSNPATETGFGRQTELVVGTSLWKDAWRRLLKNKLAVFGLIVVGMIIIASLIGPTIIKVTTGYTYDYIPSNVSLLQGDAAFSWARWIVFVEASDGHRQLRTRYPGARSPGRPNLS